jgi:nucleoside-diphosphate-sugar epimerase
VATTVLVTGGAGFVGSYVVRDLLAARTNPVVFDTTLEPNALASVLPDADRKSLTFEQGDVTDAWTLLRACERHDVDRIVHLASPLTRSMRERPATGIAAMCGGSANVFEAARALRLPRVVWVSSIAVFGNTPGPVTAATPRRPDSLYGSGKALCEDLARTYRDEHDVDSIGLRLPALYGPWRLRGWDASFGQDADPIYAALTGVPIVVREPERRLNWLYVEDASRLVCHALDVSKPAEHVFTTSGEAATRREFAALIGELVPSARITVEQSAGETAEADGSGELDDTPLRTQVGYPTRRTLGEGIAKTVEVYRGVSARRPE